MQVPSTWSVTQPAPGGPAPTLGEHGREILQPRRASAAKRSSGWAEQNAVTLAEAS